MFSSNFILNSLALILFFTLRASSADLQTYEQKADAMNLYDERYWHLLLHMNGDVSEIDNANFFLAKDGKRNPKSELDATLESLYHEKSFDDNATACRYPARLAWLQEKLQLENLPEVKCTKYNETMQKIDPKSVTMVFAATHINVPGSMFGHTFLRINSSYHSRLLSYAINYAASVDASKENPLVYAYKGVFGGYEGDYTLMPYYDKLKEYRDSEDRDIWEYDLNLTPAETLAMTRHIWELNKTTSKYYFLTQNCSYNMLWLLEIARPSLHLREKFHAQVVPFETVHAIEESKIVKAKNYRPSQRSQLLGYEKVLTSESREKVFELVDNKITIHSIRNNDEITLEQKQYIFEATQRLLEYKFSKELISKEEYQKHFHELAITRADLCDGEPVNITTPSNPDEGHRSIRTTFSEGVIDGKSATYLGIRPTYQDLFDSDVGFLRGTQIEILDLEIRYTQNKFDLQKATLFSIASMSQRGGFFHDLSWRAKTGFDRDALEDEAHYIVTAGAGGCWGNELGYLYLMADPFSYVDHNASGGVGSSLGFVIDKSKTFQTNAEATHRWYTNSQEQWLFDVSENIRFNKNIALQLTYSYRQREINFQDNYKASLHYFF